MAPPPRFKKTRGTLICQICDLAPDSCICETHKEKPGVVWCDKCRHRMQGKYCTNAKCPTRGGSTGGRSPFGKADKNERKRRGMRF